MVPTDPDDLLLPVLRQRSSPVRFDAGHDLSDREEAALLEAARWAPSAGNSQPWRFHLGRRGTPEHAVLVEHLAPSSRRWATDASALVVNLTQAWVDDPTIPFSDFADYDLGQAVAHLTIQAVHLGLGCRQFRAFDLDGLTAAIGPPPGVEIRTMTAIGRPLATGDDRTRRSIGDLAW